MLTDEQQAAVDAAIEAIEDDRLFKIGGYAGTGKTTTAKYIAERVRGCMAGAFTGKAAYRLTQKGLPASTIHRHIYQGVEHNGKKLVFNLKNEVDGDWFLIDEGSMIPAGLWDDMSSFGLPILLLGDPGQLEPVGADPRLMHKCDVVLQKIHRQAAESGIIRFATDVRMGTCQSHLGYDDVAIHRSLPATVKDLMWADIIICAFNHTRIRINRKYRQIHKCGGILTTNEKIIVLRNNREYGVFNGQILTVMEALDDGKQVFARLHTDDGRDIECKLFRPQFGHKPISNFRRDDVVLADYGYAITCHKAQGSEWDKVVVIDEQCPKLWEAKRWRYTAITRAAKELRYFTKG